ncbi:unnamed protein product [Oppiella nova]|uniref:4-hydroxyphenylpyruvate dioxygenase n=1 Tax=Oppiella nova TaxID=334625 RepID=A0A7R9L7W4_9ACAR|nr:unnamed protein product [Oppiella nova]CAG2156880.1 unnamed protein product [Oppiella nova]
MIGFAKAKALMLTAEKISADEAERLGMIYKVVEDDQLQIEVVTLAEYLATQASLSFALIKQAMRALTAPDGMIRIPLNEDSDKGNGQIAEFLADFNGEGIQHIAFITDDLISTWDKLKGLGLKFMTAPPETYYEMLKDRLPDHGEPTEELQKRGILLDGNTKDDDDGFGEGNFKALFESIERDQIRRGVLEAK